MDSGPTLKHKVTVKFSGYKSSPISRPTSRNNITNIPSRPVSPVKSYVSASPSLDPSQAFRPKAKVNSSATARKAVVNSAASGSTSSTPRAGSPAKLTPRIRTGVISPIHKAASSNGQTARSPPAVSAPELRLRSLTTTASGTSSLSPTEDTRARAGSVSLHHAVSFSSFHASSSNLSVSTKPKPGTVSANASPRLMSSKSTIGISEREKASSPTRRIRSKVSNMARTASPSPPASAPTSPPAQTSTRTRASSISSNFSQQPQPGSPPQQFYPITTATPAANPHRFASTRPPIARSSPPVANHIFQSFGQKPKPASSEEAPTLRLRGRISNGVQAKVDPALIPLPPQSPPASALSFSSRSSISRSSASPSFVSGVGGGAGSHATSTVSSRLSPAMQHGLNSSGSTNMDHLKTTLDNLMQYTSGLSADDSGGDSGHDRETDGEENVDHKVKAAAKSNRKIADLEITNRSLLAINATLEATKHRQAKEIRDLRRKLRESRLILPPRTFRAVKSSLGPAEIADDEEEEGEEDDDGEDEATAGEGDEIYQRVKLMLDKLVKSGRSALEREVSDFPEGSKGTAKVLTAEELRDWHGTDENHDDHDREDDHERDDHDHDDDHIPADVDASYDDNIGNETVSEDEVESMTIPPSSPTPPILITQPT